MVQLLDSEPHHAYHRGIARLKWKARNHPRQVIAQYIIQTTPQNIQIIFTINETSLPIYVLPSICPSLNVCVSNRRTKHKSVNKTQNTYQRRPPNLYRHAFLLPSYRTQTLSDGAIWTAAVIDSTGMSSVKKKNVTNGRYFKWRQGK